MHATDSGSQNVPGFLIKLLKIVDDPECNDLISWNSNGTSFIIHNQARFAKELLPIYFKHNNMASFIRQLNMYGFRKVSSTDQGGMHPDNDKVEFYHIFFIKNQESLLMYIKRKVPSTKGAETKQVVVKEMISDVKAIRGKQENIESLLLKMKQENESLWREVASLRQKHAKQQQLVEKILQFLMMLVQPSKNLALKRKIPLMILDSVGGKNLHLSLDDDSTLHIPVVTGPVIHDVTDAVDNMSSDNCNLCPSPTHAKISTVKSSEVESVSSVVDSTLDSPLNTTESLEPLSVFDELQPSVLDLTSADNLHRREPAFDQITDNQSCFADSTSLVSVPDSLVSSSTLNTPLIEVSPVSPLATATENGISKNKTKEQSMKSNINEDEGHSFPGLDNIISESNIPLDDSQSGVIKLASEGNFSGIAQKTLASSKIPVSLSSSSYVESSSVTSISDSASVSPSLKNTSVTGFSSITSPTEVSKCSTPITEHSLNDAEINIVENIQPSFVDLLEAICEPGTSSPLTRNTFNDHLESTETELDWLQEQLLHGGLNVESSSLLEFFSTDESAAKEQVSSSSPGCVNDSEEPSGEIVGNELMQFSPLLLDLMQNYNEMTSINTTDLEENCADFTQIFRNDEATTESKVTSKESLVSENYISEQENVINCSNRKSPKPRRKRKFVKNRSS